MSNLTCAISIATHNRLPELQRTLAVIAALSPQPDEILICADGCTDGTVDFVRQNYPQVTLLEHPTSRGSIRSRIELMHAAKSDIVASLDDDSYPTNPAFITLVRELFTTHPHVAVASFPQRTDEFPETLKVDDFGLSTYVANYVNAAAAFRRDVYLRLEGWPPEFEHAYDESDYTLQCLSAGYAVYYATHIIIRHHFTSLKRNEIRTHHRHARNEQWSAWRHCPAPLLIPIALYRAASQANYARKRGLHWLLREPLWWPKALAGLPAILKSRHPVPVKTYRAWLQLIRHPLTSSESFHSHFPSKISPAPPPTRT